MDEGKRYKANPIRRIGLNGGNCAREIVIQIASALEWEIHEDDKGVSAYGGNTERIADHCTYMQTWVDDGTWSSPYRYDIVIEDEATSAKTQVKEGYDFTIVEFVSNAKDISVDKAKMIAYDLLEASKSGNYANNIRGERRLLESTHNVNESKNYKNMKKNV